MVTIEPFASRLEYRMKRLCSESTRGPGFRSSKRAGGALRLWASLAAALGLVLMLGGAARAMGPDCNPNAPGTVYPPTDCSALTSSNAIGLGGRLSVSGGGFQPAAGQEG